MAHCYRWEGGGAAAFGGIQPQPVDFEPDGTIELGRVEAFIKPDDPHYARTRLVCLENTQAGKPLPTGYPERLRLLADRHGLSLHLDGARLCNAAVAQGVPVAELCRQFDSVNLCLSKGLGAPVGSLLCGGKDFIRVARRWRKVAGGGMRQAGILASAGIFALENNVGRLAEDHANARLLAEGLAGIDEVSVDPASAETNMVFVSLRQGDPVELEMHLREQGVIIRAGRNIRLVTHLDVDATGVQRAVEAFKSYFAA
jgi:threonine aldolase